MCCYVVDHFKYTKGVERERGRERGERGRERGERGRERGERGREKNKSNLHPVSLRRFTLDGFSLTQPKNPAP